MKKLSSLGKILHKVEQKKIIGGEGLSACSLNQCHMYIEDLRETYRGNCDVAGGSQCACVVVIEGTVYVSDPNSTFECYG